MRKRILSVLALAVIFLSGGPVASVFALTLTDKSGNTYDGEIHSLFENEVEIDLASGTNAKVKLDDLTDKDQATVTDWAKKNPDKVNVYTKVDVNPLPTHTQAPVVPWELKQAGAHGLVAVACVVDEKGNVLNPTVLKSSMKELEKPAVDAIAQWKFQPAKKDGKAVKVRIVIPIKFT